ncbi:putative anthocyanin 6''-O-malonyltransferase [Helianthus annuus]|nr:putative anthocyanin 6''-O-malonyltransferase [Helianthus annuus]
MFYHLIPLLGQADKTSGSTKIPMFSLQVTLFPNSGISIGVTHHHCLGDASTIHLFLKAWTSITRCGTDASFLANGALPLYDRVVINPKFDESYLKLAKVENFKEEYQPPKLCGPTNKVRATFILPWTVLNKLKTLVSTQVPTLSYVSSFTVACAYVWSCMAKTRKDELQVFRFVIDCRARMDPPIPLAYFGNCVIGGCKAMENTTLLTGKVLGFWANEEAQQLFLWPTLIFHVWLKRSSRGFSCEHPHNTHKSLTKEEKFPSLSYPAAEVGNFPEIEPLDHSDFWTQ